MARFQVIKISQETPQYVGRVRHGRVMRFTGCCTVLKSGISYPQTKTVRWDADRRWHKVLYMWADVENEHGMTSNIGLMVPVRVIDDVLDKVLLPRLSILKKHDICVNPKWVVTDEDDDDDVSYINRSMLLAALNKNRYDILWQCDDMNGRVTYEITISN